MSEKNLVNRVLFLLNEEPRVSGYEINFFYNILGGPLKLAQMEENKVAMKLIFFTIYWEVP